MELDAAPTPTAPAAPRRAPGRGRAPESAASKPDHALPNAVFAAAVRARALQRDRGDLLEWARAVRADGVVSLTAEAAAPGLAPPPSATDVNTGAPPPQRRTLRVISSDDERRVDGSTAAEVEAAYAWAREEVLVVGTASTHAVLVVDEVGTAELAREGFDAALRTLLSHFMDAPDKTPLVVLVLGDDADPQALGNAYNLELGVDLVVFDSLPALAHAVDRWMAETPRGRAARAFPRSRARGDTEPAYPQPDDAGTGPFYRLVRFPLLLALLSLVAVELLLYALVVSVVVAWEWATRRHGAERAKLAAATSYASWKRVARQLDILEGRSPGRIPADSLMQSFCTRLEEALEPGADPAVLMDTLADVLSADSVHQLFPEAYYALNNSGTNVAATRFSVLIERAVKVLATDERLSLSVGARRDFLQRLSKSYGVSSLCLSGGASNAYFHLGCIRALLDEGLLPKHVTGASGGALIGAFIGTRTDEELREVLTRPEVLARTFDPAGGRNYLQMARDVARNGTIFNPADWEVKMRAKVCGDLTFKQAFERTGRTLTIQVFDMNRSTRALNAITAPDVVIWSAVLASSAIPLLLPPIQLRRRDRETGALDVFHGFGVHFRDGSFESEFPMEALSRLFNSTFTIVSQVNPHITPFVFEHRGSPGLVVERGASRWRGGFLGALLERVLKSSMKGLLALIDDFRLMPKIHQTNLSRLFLGESFAAHGVTVYPRLRLWHFYHLALDKTPAQMASYLLGGCGMTFPKIGLVADRMRVERALEAGLAHLASLGGEGEGAAGDADDGLPGDASRPDVGVGSEPGSA